MQYYTIQYYTFYIQSGHFTSHKLLKFAFIYISICSIVTEGGYTYKELEQNGHVNDFISFFNNRAIIPVCFKPSDFSTAMATSFIGCITVYHFARTIQWRD